jgi:hypothetical protein
MVRAVSPRKGPVGTAEAIWDWPIKRKLLEVFMRVPAKLPMGLANQFRSLMSTDTLVLLVAIIGGLSMLSGGLLTIGIAAALTLTLGPQLALAIQTTVLAATEGELDEAAQEFADFIASAGLAALQAKLARLRGGAGKEIVEEPAPAPVSLAELRRLSGMPADHIRIFQEVAQETNRIIAVRNTNPMSTKWIERGFPAKPMEIKIKTSSKTGIVTAETEPGSGKIDMDQVKTARAKGYYVVDGDGIARNAAGQELKLSGPAEWKPEAGQVVDFKTGKPLVGDYDLLGVIDPNSPGANLVLATSDGVEVPDQSNPQVRAIANRVNTRIGQQRVMHGAQDGFAGLPDKGGSTVFFPDGNTMPLKTPQDVSAFYEQIGRQTRVGKYSSGDSGGPATPQSPPNLKVLPGGKK